MSGKLSKKKNQEQEGAAPVAQDTKNAFEASLDSLTDEDIVPGGVKARRHSTGWYVNRILFILCMAVLAWCVWRMVVMLRGYQHADDIYSSLSNEFYIGLDQENRPVALLAASDKSVPSMDYQSALKASDDPDSDINADVSYNVQFELLRANLLNLKRKNQDLYGWIRIDDTNIDYPVMQGDDNEYYLSHAYTGDFVPAGAIFVDCNNSSDILLNHNVVMYGHNMSNGAMFNNVGKYMDREFFDTHPYIVVTTLDGIFTYEVFSVYQTTMDYKYIQTDFASHEDFVEWAYEMRDNSVHVRQDMEFDLYDRTLTLSTCTPSGGYWRNRYALHAKLVKVEHGIS